MTTFLADLPTLTASPSARQQAVDALFEMTPEALHLHFADVLDEPGRSRADLIDAVLYAVLHHEYAPVTRVTPQSSAVVRAMHALINEVADRTAADFEE
ncbi:MAG TPA: hypothetical protein VN324_06050 [Quisquiliibacterium sp.]|nr:hypothetical protein [Quisquiliibacterium sp.]